MPRRDTAACISSGILETYCLGLTSAAEALQVEEYAKLYPAVQTEIDNITALLEEYAMINRIDPTGGNKIKLLLALYQQVCGTGKVYPPLIKENTTADDLKKWLTGKAIPPPRSDHDNLSVHELPSTNAVTNFMV